MDLRAIIDNLVDIGFYSVILPFLLVYVIVFAILEKSKIFSSSGGDNSHVKNVNSVIAFVFGVFTIASIQTVMYLEGLILNIVVFIIFILCVLILLGFIFGEDYFKLFQDASGNLNKKVAYPIAIIVFLVALNILFEIVGTWEYLADFFDSVEVIDSDTFSTVLVLGLVGAVIYWITNDGSKTESKE